MRCVALPVRWILVAALLSVSPAGAEEITVQSVALRPTEAGLVVDADFAFELTPRLADIVVNGVPLYFRADFELTRPRWYWFDQTTATSRLQLRLSYHALSRQYRVSAGLLQQNFASLEEALNVVKRIRHWRVVERSVALTGGDYQAAVRMRLDISMLPKPFQLSALTSRDLTLESPWHRFTLPGLQQAPAPVESREIPGAPPR